MNIDKEVNMKLFQQQQEQSRHLDYEKEFGIYKAIANGNMEEVKPVIKNTRNTKATQPVMTKMVCYLPIHYRMPSITL